MENQPAPEGSGRAAQPPKQTDPETSQEEEVTILVRSLLDSHFVVSSYCQAVSSRSLSFTHFSNRAYRFLGLGRGFGCRGGCRGDLLQQASRWAAAVSAASLQLGELRV